LKKYELEAFFKSFFLFFALQATLLWMIYSQSVSSHIKKFDTELLSKMKVCSYTLKCKDIDFAFVDKKDQKTDTLIKNKDEVYALFDIPNSKEYLLKVFISKSFYDSSLEDIKQSLKVEYIIYLVLIMILSLLFSMYSLYPLKKALKLNEEFIKDILHDYNTPISSLIINFKLLKKEIGENKKISRMQESIDTMLSLQNNLKYFLQQSKLQTNEIYLKELIEKRVSHFKNLYPELNFQTKIQDIKLKLNEDAFTRIIDNLLSNACKYNTPNGFVKVYGDDKTLTIQNSSNGIKDKKKVFERYYKEHQRGMGLGLNIVKKLSSQMNIDIKLDIDQNNTVKVTLKFK